MLELLEISLKVNADISKKDLVDIGLRSYEIAEKAQFEYLHLPDTNIHIWVEQGSINFKYKIFAAALVIYNVVSGVDGFVGGIEKIVAYSTKAINYIAKESIELTNKGASEVLSYKSTAGFSGKVKTIMIEVQRGQLRPEEATTKIEKLLEGEQDEKKNEFIESFKNTFKIIYRTPIEQLNLFPYEVEDIRGNDNNKRKSSSKPYSPPLKPQLEGVEIWQDSKSKERKVRTYIKR